MGLFKTFFLFSQLKIHHLGNLQGIFFTFWEPLKQIQVMANIGRVLQACLDSILCGEGSTHNAQKLLTEVSNCLVGECWRDGPWEQSYAKFAADQTW